MVGEDVNLPTKLARLHPDDYPGGFELAIGHYISGEPHSDNTVPIEASCPYCGTQLIAWPDYHRIDRVISVSSTPYIDDGTCDCVVEQVDGTVFMLCGCPSCKSEFVHPREILLLG